ncbi:helix-turn-helix domain-containing protein [Candidatus Peregrinibacteria bacterium]|nr:helix-turn-helix domain-containing protein [Candidatus Peregrinibacteria bacterium]
MNEFISTTEAAKILGINRVTLFNWIKSGKIKAAKVGRNYIVHRDEVKNVGGDMKNIDKGVARAVKEYGETLKLLKDE